MVFDSGALAVEEPKGLIMRGGLVRWRASLKEARGPIEEEIVHKGPQPLLKMRGQPDPPDDKFSCQKGDEAGVVYFTWACCVDLGEKDIVHFATLWFHNDRFYAYEVNFDSDYFSELATTLGTRFGKPSKEEQETQVNRNLWQLQHGMGSFLVNKKRWETETTRVSLRDRGGHGGIGAGSLTVIYKPIANEISPTGKDEKSKAVLPF